jgi:hypothetical protein
MHTTMFLYDSNFKLVEQTVEQEQTEQIVELPQITQTQNVKKNEETTKVVQQEKVAETPVVKTVQKQTPTVSKTVAVSKKTETPQTEKEQTEEIQWNIWRSNLQNQIMKELQMPSIPQGVIFKFTFDLDKYGKISNIQTWSVNPSYTVYAVQYIAPTIKSMQGRSILNFPIGSTRVTTNVVGGFKITSQEKLSTPKDFNDTEVVKK